MVTALKISTAQWTSDREFIIPEGSILYILAWEYDSSGMNLTL